MIRELGTAPPPDRLSGPARGQTASQAAGAKDGSGSAFGQTLDSLIDRDASAKGQHATATDKPGKTAKAAVESGTTATTPDTSPKTVTATDKPGTAATAHGESDVASTDGSGTEVGRAIHAARRKAGFNEDAVAEPGASGQPVAENPVMLPVQTVVAIPVMPPVQTVVALADVAANPASGDEGARGTDPSTPASGEAITAKRSSGSISESVVAAGLPAGGATSDLPAEPGPDNSSDITAEGTADPKLTAVPMGETQPAAAAHPAARPPEGEPTRQLGHLSAVPGAADAAATPQARAEALAPAPEAVASGGAQKRDLVSEVDPPGGASSSEHPAHAPGAGETALVGIVAAATDTAASGESDSSPSHGRAGRNPVATFAQFIKAARTSGHGTEPMPWSVPIQNLPVQTATSVQSVEPPARAEGSPDPESAASLVQTFRVLTRDGVSEATIRLKPEHLGAVTMTIRVERGTVSAVVHAESDAVRQWLHNQEESIRAALAEQGLVLDGFVIDPDGEQQERPAPQAEKRRRPPVRQPSDGTGPQFDVTA